MIRVAAVTADVPLAGAGLGPGPRGAFTTRTTSPDRSDDVPEDWSAAVTSSRTAVRSWPLLVLAVPAAAEVWSGWVGIAQKTGFGMVSPLPGIWPSLHLDTSITFPVGVEAYAAYALRAWLAGAGVTRAPWAIITIVSCLPVLVLAMGTTLAHLLRDDALAAQAAGDRENGSPGCWSISWSPENQIRPRPDQAAAAGEPVSRRGRCAVAGSEGPTRR